MNLLMDYEENISDILSGILNGEYTTSVVKCSDLLKIALDERKEYEDYLDEMSVVYDNMNLMERGMNHDINVSHD